MWLFCIRTEWSYLQDNLFERWLHIIYIKKYLFYTFLVVMGINSSQENMFQIFIVAFTLNKIYIRNLKCCHLYDSFITNWLSAIFLSQASYPMPTVKGKSFKLCILRKVPLVHQQRYHFCKLGWIWSNKKKLV